MKIRTIARKANISGIDCWVLQNGQHDHVAEYGQAVEVVMYPRKDTRSVEQLNLYWACCDIVAENSEDDKNKIDKRCKIDCEFFADVIIKDGVNYATLDTISLSGTDAVKANEYFDKAFNVLGGYLGVSAEDLIREAQLRMRSKICKLCGGKATDKHHLFSQTKWARQKYGKHIDDERNIIWLCNTCHTTKPIPKLTEKEFCKKLGIELK